MMKSNVRDIMTTRVVAVKRGASFQEMAVRLRQDRLSGFPVVADDGKVIGVVSEADMLARTDGLTDGLTAGEMMTHPAVTVTPGDSVERAARLMYTQQVKRLPVVDPDGQLVGIISRTDVLAVFDRPDEEIRQEIAGHVIFPNFIEDPSQYSVAVHGGVVTLAGSPATVSLGHDIVREIRHVQGVVAVRDRFSYPDASQERADPSLLTLR